MADHCDVRNAPNVQQVEVVDVPSVPLEQICIKTDQLAMFYGLSNLLSHLQLTSILFIHILTMRVSTLVAFALATFASAALIPRSDVDLFPREFGTRLPDSFNAF